MLWTLRECYIPGLLETVNSSQHNQPHAAANFDRFHFVRSTANPSANTPNNSGPSFSFKQTLDSIKPTVPKTLEDFAFAKEEVYSNLDDLEYCDVVAYEDGLEHFLVVPLLPPPKELCHWIYLYHISMFI